MKDPREKQYTGDVVAREYAAGSKSERRAVMLATRWGDFLLRRADRQDLVDPELEGLVGKRIRVRGIVTRRVITILEWVEVKPR